ncbi:unnamed protein product [Zymoseptoria tritici ST99CH_3D1]|nr:unnamed protein product [Zymoseptoria tritici ST99CH_3D1]
MLPDTTPCPPAAAPPRRLSMAPTDDDNTENVDFTRAVDLPPRRPQSTMLGGAVRRPNGNDLDIVAEETSEPAPSGGPTGTGKTLLSKPAMRSRRMLGGVSGSSNVMSNEVRSQGDRTKGPGSKEAVISDLTRRSVEMMDYGGDETGDAKEDGGERRRTIFVPSDDTTMLTIHPGAHNTNRLDDTFQVGIPVDSTQTSDDSHAIKQKPLRKPKRLSLAAAPKRMPLGQLMQSPHNHAFQGESNDVAGAPTGKENIPPRFSMQSSIDGNQKPKPKPKRMSMIPDSQSGPLTIRIPNIRSAGLPPRKSAYKMRPTSQSAGLPSRNRASTTDHVPTAQSARLPPPKSASTTKLSPEPSFNTAQPAKSIKSVPEPKQEVLDIADKVAPPASLKVTIAERRRATKAANLQLFPLLTETVKHPEIFDDNWVDQQEIAVTHVTNVIFAEAGLAITADEWTIPELRAYMLATYDVEEVVILNNRLQAALQYGSIQPTVNPNYPHDRTRDIGLRRQFLNLWTNYNPKYLSAAVEVVTGRQLPSNNPLVANTIDPHAEKRNLNLFLESFFIYDVGAQHPAGASEAMIAEARERKTLQRCLMLIWLLDRVQDEGQIPMLLFRPKSQLKSSAGVLEALGRMLLPNSPNLETALSRLGYDVVYEQHPLSELQYHIDNLAVDLRDGVLLVKLVELLLYEDDKCLSPGGTTLSRRPDFNMADDVMLSEATWGTDQVFDDERSHLPEPILTRHLRYPCISDAQKLWNIRLAIDAFNAACYRDGFPQADIDPRNILYGHRVKTIRLLTNITSFYGHIHLVDFGLLLADVKRAGIDTSCLPNNEIGARTFGEVVGLLQAWATVHAAEHGIPVDDMTTSFGGPRVWLALCKTYGPEHIAQRPTLEKYLQLLGCGQFWSEQFYNINRNPTRNTTIANLAYLAATVLPRDRKLRSVRILQRVWRKKQEWKEMRRRIVYMSVGRECAVLGETRVHVLTTVLKMQRAWRSVLAKRVEELIRGVLAFQPLAKGWVVRNKGKAASHVIGGW